MIAYGTLIRQISLNTNRKIEYHERSHRFGCVKESSLKRKCNPFAQRESFWLLFEIPNAFLSAVHFVSYVRTS